jgi:hypothetical protein
MDHKLFIENIMSELPFLLADGYLLREVDRNIWFEKQTDFAGFRISFNYTEYGEAFHLSGLKASKRFNEIESVLQKVLGGNLNDYYTIYTNPDENTIPPGISYTKTENNFHFEIKETSDLHLFFRGMESFYQEMALPFYKCYESLNLVNGRIKELNNEHLSKFINNNNNLLFSRVFVIKSLCNRLEGDEYYSEIDKELTKLQGNKTLENISDILNSVRTKIEMDI